MTEDGVRVRESEPYDRSLLRDAFDADDPRLAPCEKETLFRFSRDRDRLRFFTAEAGVGRRLLSHPYAAIDEVVVREGEAREAVVAAGVEDDDHIVGVRGALPVGVLSVKSSPRQTDQHALVVSRAVLREVAADE